MVFFVVVVVAVYRKATDNVAAGAFVKPEEYCVLYLSPGLLLYFFFLVYDVKMRDRAV